MDEMDEFLWELSAPAFTIPLHEAHRFPGEVGQKALALARLAGRFVVPGGFVIPGASLQRLFLGEDPDGLVQTEILKAYRSLISVNPGPVAVRSSGVDEDGKTSSYAGQYETILGVTDEESLLAAVRRCWASGNGDRVAQYAAGRGLTDHPGPLSVLVQHLIPAEAAGVAFSINPVTGSPAEVLISAAWGLGEAVVDGLVIPDNFYVTRTTREIRWELGDKDVAVVYRDGHTVEEPVAPDRQRQFSLADSAVLKVAELALVLEQERGHAVDIEFAVVADIVYLLQVRPVTGG